jgi:lipopolysaccharide transport system permease protein
MAATASTELELHVIKPSQGWARVDLGEVWRYRELLFFLAWRQILVRYKQTALGIAWAVLQPFFLMVVFTIAFGRVARLPSYGLPYPIFSYAALLPWTLFATSLGQAANSLVGNSNLLSKVYFPRLTIPVATVLASVADFCAAFVVLVGMMFWFGIYPRPVAIVVLPALLLLALTTSLGVGLWFSALNVAYRDVQYIVPFLTQIWLFASPVVYEAPHREPWHTLFGLNPMSGVIEGFRWALLGVHVQIGPMIGLSVCVSVLLLVSGAVYFRRMERSFADIV